MSIYSSKNDYIAQVIEPALGGYAAEFDIDEIVDAMPIWHDEINDKGQAIDNKSGYMEDEDRDFWEVVEAHAA